jgi:hypothetical protein
MAGMSWATEVLEERSAVYIWALRPRDSMADEVVVFVVSRWGLRVSQWIEVRWGEREKGTWTRRISAPASASAMAIAWPIPRVPPVTRAVWPDREKSSCTVVIVSVVAVMLGKVVVRRKASSV